MVDLATNLRKLSVRAYVEDEVLDKFISATALDSREINGIMR